MSAIQVGSTDALLNLESTLAASAQSLEEAIAVARAQARAMQEKLEDRQRQCQKSISYWQDRIDNADEDENTAPYYEQLEEWNEKLDRARRARARLEAADGELSPALKRAENVVAQTSRARQFLRARASEIEEYENFRATGSGGVAASSSGARSSHGTLSAVGRATGYKRAPHDPRDWLWTDLYGPPPSDLPPRVSLESVVGPAQNQGETPQCVCYSMAALKHYDLWQGQQNWAAFEPSPIYAACKARDGSSDEDGTTIRDAFKVAVKQGLRDENGGLHNVLAYARLESVEEIYHALSLGKVVMLGLQIAASLSQLGRAAIVAVESAFAGGHCMLVVGYDAAHKLLRVRNSWGADWADNGHCLLPLDYLSIDDGFEAWTSVDEHEGSEGKSEFADIPGFINAPEIESGPPAREVSSNSNYAWFAPEDVLLLGDDGPELSQGSLSTEALDASFATVARMREFVDLNALKSSARIGDVRDQLRNALAATGTRLFSDDDLIVFDNYLGMSAIRINDDINGNFEVANGRHRLYRAQQLGIKSVPVSISNGARRVLMERIAQKRDAEDK